MAALNPIRAVKLACGAMMIVDVDIGNTRAKWRLTMGGEILDRGVIDTRGGDWSALLALRSYQPDRVRVSNVAGKMVAQRLGSAISESLGIETEFAFASASLGEVVSGYEDPGQLGVDRWLAILAGWELFRQRCVVIDAGSALTIDFLDGRARHLGGYIIPGRKLMLNALYGGTNGVRVNPLQESSLEYGQNTDAAVQNGCLAMILALIEKVTAEKEGGGEEVALVLTGGDAESVRAFLPASVVHVPDLVLDGLALALP